MRPSAIWPSLALILAICLAACVAGCRTATLAPVLETAQQPTEALAQTTSIPPTASPTPTSTSTAIPTSAPMVRLSVFEAGSLMIPFADLEKAFEVVYPQIDVELEAHGSIQVIRHVTDMQDEIDVIVPADYRLIPMLMYETIDEKSGLPYADWNIRFATNRMALCYAEHSQGGTEISEQNWAEVITRPGTRIGLSDPRFDACGYRQLMLLQLAEWHYGQRTLFEDVFMGRFAQPITAKQEDGATVLHVPELLEPRRNSTIVMRGSSIQLIPLLESGDVDYIFEYESVARQHGLSTLTLPDEINLGSDEQAELYAQVKVKLDFRRFASVDPVFEGEPIAYGVTIPSNAPHPEEAALFVAFMLGPEGRGIMADHHQETFTTYGADNLEQVPQSLRSLCVAQ